jgi:predicted nucleic acid-binding Zn ribbon protein
MPSCSTVPCTPQERPEPVAELDWCVVGSEGRRGGAGRREAEVRRPEERGAQRRESAGPRPVLASLVEAARIMGADGAVELAGAQAHWPEVAGEAVTAHARPTALRNGVLTVTVDHNAWAVELRLLSGDLLRRLQPSCPTVHAIAVQVSLERPARPE